METLALRVGDAAKKLGISRSKAYELIAAGVLPSVRIGSSIRVPVGALEKWLDDATTGGRRTEQL
jgi:excisionase family DNA binding protein